MTAFEEMFPWLGTSYNGGMSTLFHALLIAFIVGQLNAWCYMWTHRGVSYSRSFTQALVLVCIISALSIAVIRTNVFAAFGLLGGLAIIRFRTVVRDTRDSVYVLLSLVVGMAAGLEFYSAAILGTLLANLVSFYLFQTGFGSWHSLDSLLRFQTSAEMLDSDAFRSVLRQYCRNFAVISVDEAPFPEADGSRLSQCAYRIRLRNSQWAGELVAALKSAISISSVHFLVLQENEDVA